MQEDDIKKIKTLLDFEEIADSFTDALQKLDVSDDEECEKAGNITAEPGLIRDDRIPKPGFIHNIMTWTPWTPEQQNDFADMVWNTAEQICHTLIGNNIRYNNAYWWIRQACKERFGDASIPYFVHTYEKTLRSGYPGDNEDAELDRVGYEFLEYVCQKLEAKWGVDTDLKPDDETTDGDGFISLMEFLSLCAENRPDNEEEKKEPVKITNCIVCGKELTGNRKLYCSTKCCNDFSVAARRAAVKRVLAGGSI